MAVQGRVRLTCRLRTPPRARRNVRRGGAVKSNELAKLAGVTVRTLRHYHAIGLLDEPPRQANGYRDYRPEDLLRVLRIR